MNGYTMYVFIGLIGVFLILIAVGVKVGIQETSSRVINSKALDDNVKWKLITRWGA